jgi:SAM-dependent methyltransferase
MKFIIDYFRIKSIDVSYDKGRIESHKSVLDSKPILQKILKEINDFLVVQIFKARPKYKNTILEIGSGVHTFPKTLGTVITSDVAYNSELDLSVDAKDLSFKNDSIDIIIGQFVFHHFSQPTKTLQELIRVLKVNGLIVFIEPANTFLGRLIFPYLHESEYYDKTAGWENNSRGNMVDANQALSFIYFNRDLELFKKEFPELDVLQNSLLLPFGLQYIFSGGLNFKQLLPDFAFKILLRPLDSIFRFLSIHWVIILRKSE